MASVRQRLTALEQRADQVDIDLAHATGTIAVQAQQISNLNTVIQAQTLHISALEASLLNISTKCVSLEARTEALEIRHDALGRRVNRIGRRSRANAADINIILLNVSGITGSVTGIHRRLNNRNRFYHIRNDFKR